MPAWDAMPTGDKWPEEQPEKDEAKEEKWSDPEAIKGWREDKEDEKDEK